jgi:glycosyltransferase involved in cell wall biosynthesis
MHDSWPFTGGCHVPAECTRYRDACGACPALGSDREDDLSRQVFARKRLAWRDRPIRLVAPSRWLAGAARSSALFGEAPIDVIPNGLDLNRFRPRDPADARERLGLPQEARIVLFSGMDAGDDPNKGLSLLVSAMASVVEWVRSREAAPPVLLLVPGADRSHTGFRPMAGFAGIDPALGVLVGGRVDDEERFAATIAAADLLVLPSRQENQPNLVLEAMAGARPVAAFRASGLPELVAHQETGYLAEPYDARDLGAGIVWILEHPERARAMGERARARAEQSHGADLAARRYADLYREVLHQHRVGGSAGRVRDLPS